MCTSMSVLEHVVGAVKGNGREERRRYGGKGGMQEMEGLRRGDHFVETLQAIRQAVPDDGTRGLHVEQL
ncbi:hypothetical protein E2C01_102046 [Portunus trituberculatus]|uniref:Uncharacterized protein n=1 Tax=Portunus trituberculatus TaxID=210409 RepID=A0A5B7KHF1_PORTR|nr:hypothetical protein [Portunus trituberculatus]